MNQKFQFDLNFEGMNRTQRKLYASSGRIDMGDAEQEPTFSQAELDNSFEQGRKAGLKEALASIEQQQVNILSCIQADYTYLLEQQQDAFSQYEKNLVYVSTLLFERILPHFIQDKSVVSKEIESLIREKLDLFMLKPKLKIVLHSEIVNEIHSKINDILIGAGYEGRLIFEADPQFLFQTDCRIVWSDGGLERNLSQFIKALCANKIEASSSETSHSEARNHVGASETNEIENEDLSQQGKEQGVIE